jgi:hypothetical protein
VRRFAATFAALVACGACSGTDGLVSSDADYAICKEQSAQHHALLRQVVEPLAALESADDADYGDDCDSAFDSAYLSWNLPVSRADERRFDAVAAPFLSAGWERTDPAETELHLEPGDVLVEKSVDGHAGDVLFTCDTGGDDGPS